MFREKASSQGTLPDPRSLSFYLPSNQLLSFQGTVSCLINVCLQKEKGKKIVKSYSKNDISLKEKGIEAACLGPTKMLHHYPNKELT